MGHVAGSDARVGGDEVKRMDGVGVLCERVLREAMRQDRLAAAHVGHDAGRPVAPFRAPCLGAVDETLAVNVQGIAWPAFHLLPEPCVVLERKATETGLGPPTWSSTGTTYNVK